MILALDTILGSRQLHLLVVVVVIIKATECHLGVAQRDLTVSHSKTSVE